MIVWICAAIVAVSFVGVLIFGAIIMREGAKQRAYAARWRR